MQGEHVFVDRLRHTAREVGAAVLTAVMLTGILSYGGDAGPNGSAGPDFIHYDQNGCVMPDTGDTQAIKVLVTTPESPYILSDEIGSGKGANGADVHIAAENYREKMAQRYGLTIYDATPLVRDLETRDRDGQLSYIEYYDTVKSFMAQYGVDVEMATSDMKLTLGARPMTRAELQSTDTKATLINILNFYSNLPVQLVQLTGQKHLILAAGMDKNGVAAYAVTDWHHDSIVLDAPLGLSSQIVGHEVGHLLHTRICGPTSIEHDTSFAKINGGQANIYNGKTFNPDQPNYLAFEDGVADAYTQASHQQSAGDTIAACQTIDHEAKLAAGLVTYSDYHPNTAEGEAEILSQVMDPTTYVDMLSADFPVLRDQVEFELSRLYAINPHLVTYLFAIGRRPTTFSGFNCNATNITIPSAGSAGAPGDKTHGLNK